MKIYDFKVHQPPEGATVNIYEDSDGYKVHNQWTYRNKWFVKDGELFPYRVKSWSFWVPLEIA